MTANADIQPVDTDHGRYVIRPYAAADLPAALTAWQAAFGKPACAELWRWKYHDAPLGYQILLCVHESGEVAALYGGVPFAADWRGRRLCITQLMDVFSHPDHRRQLGGRGGLYARTALSFFGRYGRPDGSALMYGLPGERASRLGRHRLGYRPLADGLAYLVADTTALVRLRCRPFAGRLMGVRGEYLAGLDRLAATGSGGRLQARRDADFFRWRFLHHPERGYRLLRYGAWASRSGGAWRGYAVVLAESEETVLVDVVLPDDDQGARDMLRRIGALLAAYGFARLRTWLPAAGADAARLQALGFASQPEPLGIVPTARLFDSRISWSDASGALHYTMADSDLY
jgi:hypothetical protein